jgi:DNA polymerase epsilon subunit 1
MIRHYLKSDLYLASTIEHCRYFHVPVGNLPRDTTLFGADLFYARHLRKHNFVLWAATAALPDFGGKEADDSRLQSTYQVKFKFLKSLTEYHYEEKFCIVLMVNELGTLRKLVDNYRT